MSNLTTEQIAELMDEGTNEVKLEALLARKQTKLVAVNALRKQAGIQEVLTKEDQMTVQDKRGWLVMLDLWREGITDEHAKELLEGIYGNKNDQASSTERED